MRTIRKRSRPPETRVAVAIGPQPPPRHGLAVSNRAAVGWLGQLGWTVRLIDTAPARINRGVRYYVERLNRLATGLVRVGRPGVRHLVYLSASGGAGLYADLLLLLAGTRFGRVGSIIHHHSFAYIEHRSQAMALLLRATAGRSHHVVLCARMRDELCATYGLPGERVTVLSNMALRRLTPAVTESDRELRERTDPFVVGFLGALSVEKGIDVFISVASQCRQLYGQRVSFRCAGDPSGLSNELLAELERNVDHVGILDGPDVMDFVGRCNVILFPSRYVNEAQPNVIVEALACGVPVLATDRGCIPEMLSPHLADLVVPIEAFVEEAMSMLARSLETSNHPGSKQWPDKHAARVQYLLLHDAGERELEAWFSAIEKMSDCRTTGTRRSSQPISAGN